MRTHTRVLLIVCAIIIPLVFYYQTSAPPGPRLISEPHPPSCRDSHHPIDDLLAAATEEWLRTTTKETIALKASAIAYRTRRGRHPPPGFDAWYNFARSTGAVIVEDFFDQIYHDLEPFWGLRAKDIRASIAEWTETVTIRNGHVQSVPNNFFRTKVWVEMISRISAHLPDMDIALNHLDEARSVAPRHVVDAALAAARQQQERMMDLPLGSFVEDMSLEKNTAVKQSLVEWSNDKHSLHKAIRDSCPANSALASHPLPWLGNAPRRIIDTGIRFVENTSTIKDVCKYPQMTRQHGDLVEPATVDFTTSLLPLFTGSKLPVYNDIVIPEPSYYSDDEMFTGKTRFGDWSTYYTWKNKIHALVWRGGSTGGAPHDENWRYFHRHRLISRLNATETDIEAAGERPATAHFADWLATSADAAFTRLFCGDARNADHCPQIASHFRLAKPIKMASQYQWKYLPDTDGNSISERFRAFLLSNSAPIKATIFDDWHDHRLLAWQHYIPMQISYTDLYDIMAYFLGYDKTCAHDAEGERIAQNGRIWSEKVLRKDDMVIYLYRVLLEYARVVHDNRDHLGYVGDLS